MTDFRPHDLIVASTPGPVRQLLLRFRLVPDSDALTNLRLQASISICGVLVYEGDAHHWNAIGHPSLIMKDEGADVHIHIPLYRGLLAAIEERRRGRDAVITFRIGITYSIAHQIPDQGHWLTGETKRANLDPPGSGPWTHEIPQSKWLEHLERLGWQSTELLEIPLELDGDRAALDHLEAAKAKLAVGDWPGVLARSYNALEAAAPQPKTAATHRASHLSEEAQEALDVILYRTKKICHEGRHNGRNPDNVTHSDAQMVLLVASGLVQYFSGAKADSAGTPEPMPAQ